MKLIIESKTTISLSDFEADANRAKKKQKDPSVYQRNLYETHRIMNIVRVTFMLLYFGFSESSIILHLSWIDSLIEYITKETDSRQVIFTSNLVPNEQFENRIIDKLFVKIVQNIPTVKMNIVELYDKNILRPGIEIDENFAVGDTSTTFFIHVHESRGTLDFRPSEKIVDFLMQMSVTKMQSKFLLVVVSPIMNDGFEDFLQYAWTKLLLDFTLIELILIRMPGKLIGINYSVAMPTVHQLNHFKDEYTRKNWTSSVEWFPNKVKNMWGHRLKIGVTDQSAFSVANIKLVEIVAQVINFSMYQPKLEEFLELKLNSNPTGVYNLMQSGKLDLMAYLSPHYTDNIRYNTQRTAMIRMDKLCPVVPILPTLAIPVHLDFFEAYLISFMIVALFSIVKRAFRFKDKFWRAFNILRVLLGVSVNPKPRSIPERLLLTCLLFVSTIYSSNIYAALTNISLQTSAEREFRSFEDLTESNLIPIISSYMYNKTFDHAKGALLDLKRRTILQPGNMYSCVDMAATYKNVTCFLSRAEAKVLVKKINWRRGHTVKIAQPCFWSDSVGFLLALGSPYRSRIDDLLGRMRNTGLLKKLYTNEIIIEFDGVNYERIAKDAGLDVKENMKTLRQQLLAIAIVGYSISLLTFVAEFLVDRALKYKRRNVIKKVESF